MAGLRGVVYIFRISRKFVLSRANLEELISGISALRTAVERDTIRCPSSNNLVLGGTHSGYRRILR